MIPSPLRPRGVFRSLLVIFAPFFVFCFFTTLPAAAEKLAEFSSDGCSLFPDGTIADRGKWCDCCLQHDIAYWRGGTKEERERADTALRDCVIERTSDRALAETMYLGVRTGGHPVFPAWYRWAYGWSYGRGFKPLSDGEREQVRKELSAYWLSHPGGYCAEKHGTMPKKERGEDQ